MDYLQFWHLVDSTRGQADRAEHVQLLFSRAYDETWRDQLGV